MREITITDPHPPKDRRSDPEKILLLVSRGDEESWGEFEPLRHTSWAAGVRVIRGDDFANALHGRILPLQRALGRDPKASARRVSDREGVCPLTGCIQYDPQYCRPGGKKKGVRTPGPPDCYEPPLEGSSPEIALLFQKVALAWREGRHTIVVDGKGFNLL